jgi:hypothetical protein
MFPWSRLMLGPFVAGALTIAPAAAEAAPEAWFVWDRNASFERVFQPNRDFTGPTTIHAAVVVRGLSGEIRAHQVWLRVRSREATYPDALRFDDAGCQAGRGIVRPGPGPGEPHSLLTPNHRTLVAMDYQPSAGTYPELRPIAAASTMGLPGLVAHPESVYVLLELDLDLGLAVAGPGTDGRCGCADQKVSITITTMSYLDGAGTEHLIAQLQDCIGWNDPDFDYCYSKDCFTGDPRCNPNPIYASTCDAPTPATPTSWGRIKSSYR